MADIIHLLPDSVANQIAAGEVIQRPASVVKELVENAIDAQADSIRVIIKDSGKTLIQVIDNGCGMTDTDARLAFERHATSKIQDANDLFSIRSKGFRGEALPSIAAVTTIDLKTKTADEKSGTHIRIGGSRLEFQEATQTQVGSNFMVKNLFFNVPARRKFLKTDSTELKHIIKEFQRIVLGHPDISFSLTHNGQDLINLRKAKVKPRIVKMFGKNMDESLINLKVDTSIVKIRGYITKPEKAKKTSGEQFFFVNMRYIRHGWFYKAVSEAYEKILPQGTYPSFFIYFELDPAEIDINIHPTKTEVKFTDERAIYQLLFAGVKEALGKANVVPSLHFEKDDTLDMHLTGNTRVTPPKISVDPDFNPFKEEDGNKSSINLSSGASHGKTRSSRGWEKLYPDSKEEDAEEQENILHSNEDSPDTSAQNRFFQIKERYILTAVKSGLMVIDQSRAHERILYEKFMMVLTTRKGMSQKQLYPESIQLSPENTALLMELMESLNNLGFEISVFGDNSFVINGLPADLEVENPKSLLEELLEAYSSYSGDIKLALDERIAYSMARTSALHFRKKLNQEEMQALFYQLMACQIQKYSPAGKPVVQIIDIEELEKRFK